MSLTPTERALRARLGAHTLWAKVENPAEQTANARRTFLEKFENEVDPDRVLPETERARRADHARRAHFTRLAYASARARRARTQAADARSK